jgi:glyoxylase-like metal-dependent hydrolase (beta-lactamase superfamily II)
MSEWKIGDVTVKRIIETEGAWRGTWILPSATAENVRKEADWLCPVFSTADGKLNMSIHALVIESQGKSIIVDTCIGNDKVRSNPAWNKLKLPFLEDLAKTGYRPEQINYVVCTHLHVDHVGWNTKLENGKWVPTFTNARYILGGTEWDYWSKFDGADMRDPVEDSVRPIVEQHAADLVDPTHKITSEVWLEPTPGHTPGHMSVRISSKGKDAVITGDLMHHPIQCKYPEWDDGFDSDGALAKKTRRAFCEKYADSGVLVFGTHFATPSAGKITRAGDSFRFAPA